jgi:putative ABC transport system permease protein
LVVERCHERACSALLLSTLAANLQLALGATLSTKRWPLRSATRSACGTILIINQMSAAGVITLPGMDPVEAVKCQILRLFLLTGAGGLASAGAVYLAARAVTDDRHRLWADRLK